MSKSLKFKNNIYLDSSSIIYKINENHRWSLYNLIKRLYTKEQAYNNDMVKQKTYNLQNFGIYLVTASNVGNSNIYGQAVWMVFCGASSSNTGQVRKIYGDDGFVATLINGTTLQIDYPSIYHTTTINQLNIY